MRRTHDPTLIKLVIDYMMPSESTNVFVSYSHADASLVAPVVKLLRVNKSFVFQDVDDIQPGKRWRSEIGKALTKSHLVVVFWCDHARRSSEVSNEWKAAIELQKDLLPLLLDATPLPPELGDFQWIDFRGTVGANHSSADSLDNVVPCIEGPSPRSAVSTMSGRWLSVIGLASVLGIAALLSSFNEEFQSPPLTHPGQIDEPAGTLGLVIGTLFLLGVVFAVSVCIVWMWRCLSNHVISIARARRHPREIERFLASEIEAEILRRTAWLRDGRA